MAKVRRPRHGSLQFWPRKKSKKMNAKVKSWANTKNIIIQGFAGYKAGMTHIVVKDIRAHSPTKGENVVWPVTVIECPSIKVLSIRLYKRTPYGPKVFAEYLNPKLDKSLSRKIVLQKKQDETKLKQLEERAQEAHEIRLNVYTQPRKSGLGKKTPEVFELKVGGNNIKAAMEYAKGILDKEVKVSDIIKQGTKVDIHAVTKGKGFQGSVKRFGVNLKAHKSEKGQRGNIYGSTNPSKIHWGIPAAGRMGFNLRTEYNKDIIYVGDKPEKINPKGGFLHYGLVKTDYILVKGSIPGSSKRLITITEPIRNAKGLGNTYEMQYVSQESKQ